MHLSEEKKIIEKYGFKWMVLVLFESQLYIASVVYWKQTKKKDIVHDVFSSHNDVHLWNVYQIKKWGKKQKKKKSVDALIVHVVRFSRFDFKFLTALQVALKDKRLVGQDIMKNNKEL